ncbi:MAG: two-component system regulatory protein YycI [Lactobacillales bacterium]|jgi:regulatory protein YycI of two-component signal transduction system YycFG|nr:two-component system regulatory protein YycI [Lactobacillales bacterium]
MDFRPVERIFTACFFLFNIFLFILIYQQTTDIQLNKDSIYDHLKEDAIDFPALNNKQLKGNYISAEKTIFDYESFNSEVLVSFSNPPVIKKNKLVSSAKILLENKKYFEFGSEYKYFADFSNIASKDAHLDFYQVFQNVPLIDEISKLQLLPKDQAESSEIWEIGKYKQAHSKNIDTLLGQQTLISEEEAIKTLYNHMNIPEKSNILWIRLGYSRIANIHDKNIFVPTWFVKIQLYKGKTQIEKVNAINNSIITNTEIITIEKQAEDDSHELTTIDKINIP